jgi:hypothetical protein
MRQLQVLETARIKGIGPGPGVAEITESPGNSGVISYYLGVDGFYTCWWCTLRDDDDDFEAHSTAAIIRSPARAPGCRTHILTDAFDDLQATDAAGNDAWIKSEGKDCRSRPQEPTLADVLAKVRVLQVRKIDCSVTLAT